MNYCCLDCGRECPETLALCRVCVGRMTRETARDVAAAYFRWKANQQSRGDRSRFDEAAMRAKEEIAALNDGSGKLTTLAERDRRAAQAAR